MSFGSTQVDGDTVLASRLPTFLTCVNNCMVAKVWQQGYFTLVF